MTDQFEELAAKEVVFNELRNIMDMSVIAALIEKEDLFATANLDAPLLSGTKKRRQVTQMEFTKNRTGSMQLLLSRKQFDDHRIGWNPS